LPVSRIAPPFTTHSKPPTMAASPPKRMKLEDSMTPFPCPFPYEHMMSSAQARCTRLHPPPISYSPECVEGEFSQLRLASALPCPKLLAF
jgi:hypothetical protein